MAFLCNTFERCNDSCEIVTVPFDFIESNKINCIFLLSWNLLSQFTPRRWINRTIETLSEALSMFLDLFILSANELDFPLLKTIYWNFFIFFCFCPIRWRHLQFVHLQIFKTLFGCNETWNNRLNRDGFCIENRIHSNKCTICTFKQFTKEQTLKSQPDRWWHLLILIFKKNVSHLFAPFMCAKKMKW